MFALRAAAWHGGAVVGSTSLIEYRFGNKYSTHYFIPSPMQHVTNVPRLY